ncbi:MAG: hypothetical protein GEV09_18205 [Pseudonocardiaceae bacterium]|nr:hypothetical protein [Pseudonocardiaceae bacterium]
MWATIGLAALGVIGGVILMIAMAGAGQAGAGVVTLLVILVFAGANAYCAWEASHGHNWGRIAVTVLFSISIVANLTSPTAPGVGGILLLAGLMVLWWLPQTSQAIAQRGVGTPAP